MSEISPDVLRAIAVERERHRNEHGWCCRVTDPSGSQYVNLYDVTLGVAEDAILAVVTRHLLAPNYTADFWRVNVWRKDGR